MKRILALSFAVLMLSSIGRSQAPATPPAAPTLTETEKLKAENLQLKFQQLNTVIQNAQTQQQALGAQYKTLLDEVEKEHPGFTLGPNADLVAKPKPPEAPKEVPKPPAVKK